MTGPTNIASKERPFSAEETAFLRKIKNPVLQRLFMLTKLPAAFFMGIKIEAIDRQKAVVSVPFAWRSQNPFRSTYFAAQAAAAEMSTGVLAMLALQGGGRVSMLITNMEANYFKKANKKARFYCTDGPKAREAVQKAVQTGQSVEVALQAKGYIKEDGQEVEVSNFSFTWSFKAK